MIEFPSNRLSTIDENHEFLYSYFMERNNILPCSTISYNGCQIDEPRYIRFYHATIIMIRHSYCCAMKTLENARETVLGEPRGEFRWRTMLEIIETCAARINETVSE